MTEVHLRSGLAHADPFNDLELDVVFHRDGEVDGESWRVPAFWRGGDAWTVRFSAPVPGRYRYRSECTDPTDTGLHGREGVVGVLPHPGSNSLLARGPLRVSANGRHLEHRDGTPFLWLADTWWTGLSHRIPWDGFVELTENRRAQGFTVVQLVAGLVPPEELPPSDPGNVNEGGAVWEPGFARINPAFFDHADRRIGHLIGAGILPAVVGAWGAILDVADVEVLRKHWRYVIARWAALPVVWIAGGEVIDRPEHEIARRRALGLDVAIAHSGAWTGIARYIRSIDPYGHPLTVHEVDPPEDWPLQDESLSDFDFFQSGHYGWGSMAVSIAQLGLHYARGSVVKPIIQGEIGYEGLGGIHLDDFQRMAFWMSMLGGAAGHSYGADGLFEAYSGELPLHRTRWSFRSWREGMALPGGAQVALGAQLLRRYRWWAFAPRPDWVRPRGTTLLDPGGEETGARIAQEVLDPSSGEAVLERADYPGGAWSERGGNLRAPYAAGIPGEVRIVYVPTRAIFFPSPPPTVLGLEPGVRYRGFFWEPATGTRIDLGVVARPADGPVLLSEDDPGRSERWRVVENGGERFATRESPELALSDTRVEADIPAGVSAGVVLRYRSTADHLVARWDAAKRELTFAAVRDGRHGVLSGPIRAAGSGPVTLAIEARGTVAAASVSTPDGVAETTSIADVGDGAGSAGFVEILGAARVTRFRLRALEAILSDDDLDRELRDEAGRLRGVLEGDATTIGEWTRPGWSDFGRDKHLVLDAFRPAKMPASGDWLLVLEGPGARVDPGRHAG